MKLFFQIMLVQWMGFFVYFFNNYWVTGDILSLGFAGLYYAMSIVYLWLAYWPKPKPVFRG